MTKVKIRFSPSDKTKGVAYLFRGSNEWQSTRLRLKDPNSDVFTVTEDTLEGLRKNKIKFEYV